MIHLITLAYFLMALGILTSVSLLGIHQILLFVPTCYCLYKSISSKKMNLSRSSLFLFIFLICCVVSLFANFDELKDPAKSFGKLKFLFFALSGAFVLNDWLPSLKPSYLKLILNAFFCGVIIAGGVAIYQSISSGGARSEGLIGIMRYGYASSMISILILASLIQNKKMNINFSTRLAICALIFGVAGIFLTQTRGALAGFVCALPFVLYFYKPKIGLAIGVFSVLLISILSFAYFFGNNDHGSRYLKSRNTKGDVIRQEQWKSALIATKEHPWFGGGYNNFYSQVERIKNENNFETTFYINEHAHNIFLEIAAGTGLVGFAFFLLWLISWAYECFKLENALRGVFVPFGVCLIISGQFEVIFDTNNSVMIFFIYSLSQYAVMLKNQKKIIGND